MGEACAFAFLLMLMSLLVTLGAEPWAWAAKPEGLVVTKIAIDSHDSKNLYALTTYSIGVLKSTDRGKSWTQINQGIRSYSLYQLTVHPQDPKILYLGAGGAGLYKSTDGGATWVEMNSGLQNTDIGRLVLHPDDPEVVYVVTSTGLFKSPDGGEHWVALNQRDDFTSSQQFQALIVLPTSPPTLYLASRKGLYTRREGDGGWVSVGGGLLEKKKVSALAYNSRSGRLYAAVFRRGTLETLREGGLFVSEDGGKSWLRVDEGLEEDWIRVILLDPVNPQILYLATTGRGVLKSTDGGKNWKESNVGLADPNRDIRTLVMDPTDPKTLYAGSHGEWVFRSRDAGRTWEPLPLGPHQTAEQILVDLNREDKLARKRSTVTPPVEFLKCNQCHGWTDPSLNSQKGNWRISANRRDWSLTVARMSHAAGLTPEEEVRITEFLNTYTQAAESQSFLGDEIQVSVLDGKEEEDPVVVWDGENYIAVWQTNRKDPLDYNVYGARINPEGKLLDPQGFPISTAPSNQIFIDLAWGKGQHLAVWQDLRSRQRWEIYGARFRSDGAVLDPEGIPIAIGERNARQPRVAWDGKNFLVVWMEENEGRGWDVAGVRVSPEGKVLDGERILVAKAPGDQAHPVLAWGKDHYLVAWMDRQPRGPAKISGTRIASSGQVMEPKEIVLSSPSSRDPRFPAVAWGKEQFVVVWADQPERSVHTLSGVRVTPFGKVRDPNGFVAASSANLHTFPSVTCEGGACLVVWEEDQSGGRPMRGIEDVIRDVRGTWIDLSRKTVTPQEIIIAPRAIGNHFTKVATDGQHYLVVWKDYRTGTAASLGRLVKFSQ